MNNAIKKIIIHFIFWGVFLAIPHFIFDLPLHNMARFIYIFALIVVFFYLNYFVFIPKFLSKRKFLFFITSIFLSIIVSIFFTYYISKQLPQIKYPIYHKIRNSIHSETIRELPDNKFEEDFERAKYGQIVFALLLTFAISTSIRVTQDYYENEKQKEEIEKEKYASELSLLKSQVNPHFLFNTLNSIYSLANKESEKTAQAIVKLSQLMRYMIYDADKELVKLNDEINYLTNYIELQKLRLFNNVKIVFNIEGKEQDYLIEPMLLIPFIENAFKHGVDNSSECKIDISIDICKDKLDFKISNFIINIENDNDKAGIGLKNVKDRLKLLYPNKHLLTISEENNTFNIDLQLKLKSNEMHNS